MKFKLSDMDDNTWITAGGKRVKVYEMDAAHLENTINFLRRHEEGIRLEILMRMSEYVQEHSHSMSGATCELEMEAIEKMTKDEFLILAVKPYKKMIERYAKEIDNASR